MSDDDRAWHIAYPSGRTFSLRGRLIVVQPSYAQLSAPGIVEPSGRIVLLDPRAVIRDERHEIVFTGCTTAQLVADTPL